MLQEENCKEKGEKKETKTGREARRKRTRVGEGGDGKKKGNREFVMCLKFMFE